MPDNSSPDLRTLAEEFQSHIDDLVVQAEQAPRSYTAPLRNASRILNRLADDLANQPGPEIADHTALILDTMACRCRAAAPGNLLWGTRLVTAAVEMQKAATIVRSASTTPAEAAQHLRDIASRIRLELADASEYHTGQAHMSTSASLVNQAAAAVHTANDSNSRHKSAALLEAAANSYQTGIAAADSPWPRRLTDASRRLREPAAASHVADHDGREDGTPQHRPKSNPVE